MGGKVIFVPPEKRNAAWINFPAGSVAKVTVDKGTATSIVPPSAVEMAAFTRDELPGNKQPVATHPAPEVDPIQSPPITPDANSQAVKDAIQQTKDTLKKETTRTVLPGTIISVMIGGTLNLGNYNNVKMEVTATSAEAARIAYQQEISTTVEMMKGIIRQIGVSS